MENLLYKLDLPALITIITFGAGLIVYYVQRSKEYSDLFIKCASQLHSDNEATQIAGAVMLRAFIRRRKYREKSLLLISSFLKSLLMVICKRFWLTLCQGAEVQKATTFNRVICSMP